jgi:hypothetical protein|tara:strand:+ start:7732 stop:9741 length:2010 start_codon:yes stop_codon:yes gene_type:complete
MSDPLISWDDNDRSRSEAFEKYSDSTEAYDGIARAYHRDFLDIEPNRSVKPHFGSNDYYAFRPEEQVPRRQKSIIKMCMDAYDKVGIVRNIIDLMGDFGCQGIQVVHENKSVEKFGQQWFKRISGKERSERFLNNFYRTGNVFIYRSYAEITPEISKYIKSLASDITVKIPNIEQAVVPWRYNFFNPLTMDMKNGTVSMFIGKKNYALTANTFFDNFKDGTIPVKVLETLPVEVKNAIRKQERKIDLDPERLSIHHYKKDDWQQWAHPLVYAILDDIIMLEKMKLADLAALDGAISNIRLWTLGDFDNKILPTKEGINKLRNILASNTGGGTMELVWGPELKFQESNSQVYKFLGSEKYQSVLNSIYAGLGVPPTLTGMANNGGGFTNNFISLKTLMERLQYGRDELTRFWTQELEMVRKAMGFRKPFHVVYDQMSLSDEASEKNLLLQLADRDIISHETVLERFKEVPAVEKVRLKREDKARDADKLPPKASPFHNANQKFEIDKMEKQADINEKVAEKKQQDKPPQEDKSIIQDNGRPPQKQDEEPRKKRVDTPRSKPGVAELFVWASNAFDSTFDLTAGYLESKGKSNMRQLTKAEAVELEFLRLSVFTNLEPMSKITNENIYNALNKKTPSIAMDLKSIRERSDGVDNYRKQVVAEYVEYLLSKK